ncbi:MAG: S8 family serine peptidase [Candidatus Aminicenantes bacterium]|nr:S8 family serine peptidase [Candidatus Aminicenantes bacterium]
MKKVFMVFGLGFFIFASMLLFKSSTSSQEAISQEYVPGELLVKFKPKVGKQMAISVLDTIKPKVVNYLGQEMAFTDWNPELRARSSFLGDPYLVHLRVPDEIGTEKTIEILKNNPNIEYAEPNYILKALDVIPNDPYFPLQWPLRRIDTTLAWNLFTGTSNVVVAVIDTGIDYNHHDLKLNIWINTKEIPNNKVDDDKNGYSDDYYGWNFYHKNNNPIDDSWNGHGTHVAGIIGAKGNNNLGISGIVWNIKLMALKIMDSMGYTTNDRVVKAIDYAYMNGAKISNNSYGGLPYSQAVHDAINRSNGHGHLFIAAAGNDSADNDSNPVYPASYNSPNIISVLATDYTDNLASYSNFGANTVHIGAPGGTASSEYPERDIFSTFPGNQYVYNFGTSMAAPHVTGTAALLFGKCYPYVSHTQVRRRILEKVDYLSSLNGKCVTGGRANAYKALYDQEAPNSPSNLSGIPTGWTTINLSWTDNSTDEMGFKIERKLSSLPDYIFIKAVDANQTSSFDATAQGGMVNFYRVKSWNMAGDSEPSQEIGVLIPATAPAAPSGLNAQWDWGRMAVSLRWDDMSNNELEFIIERRAEWETQWTILDSVPQNHNLYYDSTVSGDTYYSYRIKASNPAGHSYSAIVQVYVPVH